MKTSSKQLTSNRKAASAALLAALMAAALAVVMCFTATTTAYADEEETDGDAQQSVTLSTTELSSPDAVTDEYSQAYDTESWDAPPYTYSSEKVTISELNGDEGRFVQLTADEDADIDMIIVQVGNDYLESAVPDGTLKSGSTYLIPVLPDAKIMHVVLYQSKSDADTDSDKDSDDTDNGDSNAGAPAGNVDDNVNVDEQGGEGQDGDQEGQDGDQEGQDGNTEGQDGNQEGQDGNTDGQEDGDQDGDQDGNTDGQEDGDQDGNTDGQDGDQDGDQDGNTDGQEDGDQDGNTEGQEDGQEDGDQDGQDGNTDGQEDGDQDGNADGATVDEQSESASGVIVVENHEQTVTSSTSTTTVHTQVYSMSIGKTDAQSNAYLGGADFTLKTASGDVIASWTSSASGPQQIDGLRTDTSYVLVETKAPAGYNCERDINIKYDAASNRVLIDQGGPSVALDNNSAGSAVLNVKDMRGQSSVHTSASTSPKTGDNQMIPIIVGVLVVVVAVAAAVAVKARKSAKK